MRVCDRDEKEIANERARGERLQKSKYGIRKTDTHVIIIHNIQNVCQLEEQVKEHTIQMGKIVLDESISKMSEHREIHTHINTFFLPFSLFFLSIFDGCHQFR